jgi:type II secretory pathway pseudopilin PulG
MKRRLIRHGPIAILCGVVVAAILNVAAWYNLRDQRNVCRRQGNTRMTLHMIAQQIEDYRKKHGELPDALANVPDLRGSWTDPGGPPEDEWGRPLHYKVSGSGFELSSDGRDGRPGGVGLDADLFHDDRNHERSLPTFSQYFGEDDSAEVDRGRFFFAGLLAGGIVALMTFDSLKDFDTPEKAWRPAYLLCYAIAIIGIASLVGVFLLPLHIPSGH